MLGPIGSEVMAIFRLLSPHEIDAYITEEEAFVVKIEGSMTASGEELPHDSSKQFYTKNEQAPKEEAADEIDVNKQAKIIPLHAYKNESSEQEESFQQKNSQPEARSNAKGDSQLTSLGILSASQIKQQEKERLEKEKAKEDSVTVFLLKERQKMRQSKKRLIEQSALKVYQSNAAVDLHIEDEINEDGETSKSSDMRGILVNKKQF